MRRPFPAFLAAAFCMLLSPPSPATPQGDTIEVGTLKELADYAVKSGNRVRLAPGTYRMADYLSPEVLAQILRDVPANVQGRPPVWMMRFSGNDNTFDLTDVVIEIDTTLYPKLNRPGGGYTRCLFIPGNNNTLRGLTIRNTGPADRGSNGNILSTWGDGNRLEDVTLYISGSSPYGYGDLLGKGGPNLVGLQKQSGIMVSGQNVTLRRCKVISRAFGHCFYVQNAGGKTAANIRVEDCYAEGTVRSTADMLRETAGLLADWNFRTIAENRDGRYFVVSGYMKSLSEDGFRTYGGTGQITLLNCTAIHTRAGFEINGPDSSDDKTIIEGGTAIGCERAYLLGSNVHVRKSRGDTQYGPLLYLRGGRDSDVELEWTGRGSDFTVHALATIAGEGHRVRLFTREPLPAPALPIMLGYGMPAHAEMASPIRPAATRNVRLISELPRVPIVQDPQAVSCTVESNALLLADDDAKKLPQRPTPASRPAR